MNCIDLLQLLRANNGKLRNVRVYGRITGEVARPKALAQSVYVSADDICVNVDVVAVNLSEYSQYLANNGVVNKDNIYFVNASMSTVIPRRVVLDNLYALDGTISLSTRTKSPVIGMYNFFKPTDGRGTWGIHPTIARDILREDFNAENSEVYEYLLKSDQLNKTLLPESILEFPKCYSDEPELSKGLPSSVLSNFQLNKAIENDESILETPVPMSMCYDDDVRCEIGNRAEIAPINKSIRVLSESCSIARDSRFKYVARLSSAYPAYERDADGFGRSEEICRMFNAIKTNLTRRTGGVGHTGQSLLKGYMEMCSGDSNKEYLGVSVSDYIISTIDEVFDYTLYRKKVSAGGKALRFIQEYFDSAERVYAGVLSQIVDVPFETLLEALYACNKRKISFSKLVAHNPYALMVVSNKITFAQAENIAMCLGICNDTELQRDRNMGIVFQVLLDDCTNSTCFPEWSLRKKQMGIILTKSRYDKLLSFGSYLSDTARMDILTYLNENTNKDCWSYRDLTWRKNDYSGKYTAVPSGFDFDTALGDFLAQGLGVKFNLDNRIWISLARVAEKEVFVYTRAYEIYADEFSIKYDDHARIDELISEYERTKGIELEFMQKQAVHSISNNISIITGAAGSGKTTTVDCIVYVLERYCLDKKHGGLPEQKSGMKKELKEGSDENEVSADDIYVPSIAFAAPTGKAAKRLQQSTNHPVKTEHSLFGLGMSQSDEDYDEKSGVMTTDADWYIFDEQSMVTLDLMYQVLDRMETSRIIFVGDVGQLPPIGKGTPFKNFLQYLPCVVLNVSKRSAENSGITYNSNVVNKFSEPNNWKELREADDFKLIACADENIGAVTASLCKHYLGISSKEEDDMLRAKIGSDLIKFEEPLTPDDIQVVSPLAKPAYSWGCSSINAQLQDVFNPNGKRFVHATPFSKFGTEYRVGDRVIHTKNISTIQWYSKYEGSKVFTKAWGYGVVNGDVGKIVDIIKADKCEFREQDTEKPADYIENDDYLRDDASFCKQGNYFVVVKYFDYSRKEDYFVLYHAKIKTGFGVTSAVLEVESKDLDSLMLFYCGTAHKMQGSDSKLVISLLGSGKFGKFITRNMIYTQMTRASLGEYFVGNVSNARTSQLSNARTIVADDSVVTIGGLLCK